MNLEGSHTPESPVTDVIRAPLIVMATALLCGCGQGPGSGRSEPFPANVDPSREKTLVISVRTEAATVAQKALQTSGGGTAPAALFNAGLVYVDLQQVPHAYLSESLPQLNTDSWRVFPDGRMETTYRLKPNLVWQDGPPLSTEDFVFALHVYKLPGLGSSSPSPQNVIEESVAPDPRTLIIRWRQPYAEAGAITALELQALPRHILEEPLTKLSSDAFAAHPFWTSQYIGLGPYMIDRWDPGISFEAAAFNNYVLGQPKIGRIRVVYIPDSNTVFANLLAEAVDISMASSLPFNQALQLRREWEARKTGGTVLVTADGVRMTSFQLHPERVAESFRGTLDVRVRRAMAQAVDRAAINEGVFEGQGLMAETWVLPDTDYFPELDRTILKYPLDFRRSEELMNQAGYRKGSDGIYMSPEGLRFVGEEQISESAQSELTQSILLDTWKHAGFELNRYIRPRGVAFNNQVFSERAGLATSEGGTIETLASPSIPTPENRWTGLNRGSYASAEYDRLLGLWRGALDRTERNQYMIQMARVASEDVPLIPLHYTLSVMAHLSPLKVAAGQVIDIHLWEWKP